jgi:hypothetical protein
LLWVSLSPHSVHRWIPQARYRSSEDRPWPAVPSLSWSRCLALSKAQNSCLASLSSKQSTNLRASPYQHNPPSPYTSCEREVAIPLMYCLQGTYVLIFRVLMRCHLDAVAAHSPLYSGIRDCLSTRVYREAQPLCRGFSRNVGTNSNSPKIGG